MSLELKAFDMLNRMTYIGVADAPNPNAEFYTLQFSVVVPSAEVYSSQINYGTERRSPVDVLRELYKSPQNAKGNRIDLRPEHVVAVHHLRLHEVQDEESTSGDSS